MPVSRVHMRGLTKAPDVGKYSAYDFISLELTERSVEPTLRSVPSQEFQSRVDNVSQRRYQPEPTMLIYVILALERIIFWRA